MYTPKHFRADSPALVEKVVWENSFALLVTPTEDGLKLTHLPCLYDPSQGEHGLIRAHVAKQNSHGRYFDGRHPSTVVFTGPHAYVSPTWYQEHQSVPTWNYAAVHMHGKPIALDGEGSLALLMEMVRFFEGDDSTYDFCAGEAYAVKSLSGIIAFEMPVLAIDAKFKMSQNKPEGDRLRVAERLAAGNRSSDVETSRFMAALGE
jgi:transcriptional regulator